MPKYLFSILIFLVSTQVNALNPSKAYKHHPKDFKITYSEHDVQTKDGASIKLWYLNNHHHSDNLLIISHNGVGNMGDHLHRAKEFVEYGFNVVIYDYRGFGESSDFPIENVEYVYAEFFEDFNAVFNYSYENFYHKIYLYGWGIGAGISISQGYSKEATIAIAADTPFIKYQDLHNKFVEIQSPMKVPMSKLKNYADPHTVLAQEPHEHFRGLLLMVAPNDFLFHVDEMKALLERQPKIWSEFYLINNKTHKDNYLIDKKAYMRKVYSFLINS
jgi:predicted alpha/beta-fold hydrolase